MVFEIFFSLSALKLFAHLEEIIGLCSLVYKEF